MIQVVIACKENRIVSLQASGHALFAPYGSDVVCAGISAILIGGLNGLDRIAEESCSLVVEDQTINIRVLQHDPRTETCLDFMICQLETVQESYPDHIQIVKIHS